MNGRTVALTWAEAAARMEVERGSRAVACVVIARDVDGIMEIDAAGAVAGDAKYLDTFAHRLRDAIDRIARELAHERGKGYRCLGPDGEELS